MDTQCSAVRKDRRLQAAGAFIKYIEIIENYWYKYRVIP